MAPQEHSYRQPAAEPHAQYPSPFQQSSPDDYEVSGSEVDSDNQPIMSHLLRRSRSLTDANFTLELQPSGRRRSFFSKRRPKATQEQPALSTTNQGRSFTTQGRSLSGLLPNQALVSEPDGKPPIDSKRTDSKSFKTKGDSDTDATTSRPKSARWWSWGSSSKGVKPDGKVLPPQAARSPAGSNSRPTSLDLQLQPPQPKGAVSSAALAQTSPLAQPGCMSMFTAASGQPEKPVSEAPQTDSDVGSRRDATALSNSHTSAASQANAGGNASYAGNGSMLEEDRSPTPLSQQSRPPGHSRHVSWDDTTHEAAMIGGFQDSGSSQDPFTSSLHPPGNSPRSSGSQGNSLLPNSPQPVSPSPSPAKAPVSAGPDSSSAPGPSSMASDAVVGALPAAAAPAGAATRQAPGDSESALSVQAGDGEKQKKGHRRGRSLTGLIPTLKTKPKRSQSQHFEAEPTTPAAGSSSGQAGRPKTPDSKAATSNSSSLGQCFGMGRTLDEADQEERPLGVVGLRNLGNTCFVNVALQCLRYTPKLPQAIYPDLVRFSLLEQESMALPASPDSPTAAASNHNPSHSGSELPSVPESTAIAHQPVQSSNPSASLDSQANGPSGSSSNHPYPQHSMHDTGQAHLIPYSAEPQQSEHSVSQPPQIPMHQLLQHQGGEQAHPHPSQPVTIPPSHTGVAPHGHPRSATLQQLPSSKPDVIAAASASNVNSLASSDTSNHTVSMSDSPGGGPSSSGSHALGQSPLLQQQPQEQQQQQHQQQPQQQQQYTVATADSTPGDDSEKAPANQSTAARQPPPVAMPQVPLKQGEIAESFRTLVKQVYVKGNQEAVDPAQFLRRIAQLPMGADFCDGGQHDAQELFRLLLDSLHHDLNRITKKPPYEEDRDLPGEAETDKAERLWSKYLGRDNSPITDLFGGQLQSTVHCHNCKGNFTTYEPFWDLSLPIVKEGKGGLGAWLSGKSIPTTIQDCLQAFTADEVLQGDEAFKCEMCNEKCEATKRLRLFRLPQVLLLHIKRFKYTGSSREKLTNNVTFPIKGLKLNQFVSSVSSPADSNATYDLYAVSNHYGSMAGGHYTAACRVGLPEGREQWYNFNDDAVSKLSPQNVVTPCAYMLFYFRTE